MKADLGRNGNSFMCHSFMCLFGGLEAWLRAFRSFSPSRSLSQGPRARAVKTSRLRHRLRHRLPPSATTPTPARRPILRLFCAKPSPGTLFGTYACGFVLFVSGCLVRTATPKLGGLVAHPFSASLRAGFAGFFERMSQKDMFDRPW